LVGGDHEYEGRVEICLSGEWGTVCDDIWSSENAQVVCNQLGFNYSAAIAAGRAHYGAGTGPIFLDNVDCVGTEERLFDCVHQGANVHNCRHYEDAGVFCQPIDQACVDGSIRLAGGQLENEGRVEVCFNQQWGTVCDDHWDRRDAAVVCVQLGYPAEDAIPVSRALYGRGIGNIIYDDVMCTGLERNVSECRNRGLGAHNCQHSEDAGVLCKPTSNTSCHNGDIRLVGGRDSTEGRVEVCYNGRWGTVCDDLFGNDDARVICRQLGFTAGGYGQVRASFGAGSGPIFMDNLNCIGNETRLISCRNDGVGLHNCQHSEDSSVICIATEKQCNYGELQLIGGDFPNEGRVEVCVSNHWGSICDSSFDSKDAKVICSQLGYGNGEAISVQPGYFGAGLGMVWLDQLQCEGNESHIVNCSRGNTNSYSNCRHVDDASVICPVSASEASSRCKNGDVRLMNGSVPNEGLTEICFNGRWGAICEGGWDVADATVFCNQLGFPGNSVIPVGNSYFSSSSGPIFLSGVACDGTETELVECFDITKIGTHNCDDSSHAGVSCPPSEKMCENGVLRLVDGGTLLEGRVEMCFNSRWGTVCDSAWDNSDATVVCRQVATEYGLEFADNLNAISVTGSRFGGGDGPIFLKGVRCVGSEQTLLECGGATVGIHECGNHDSDAGVYCGLQPCEDGALRLSEGLPATNNTGRVEMCIRNVWTALCDETFDARGARLVCSQLGLHSNKVVTLGGDFFGHAHLIPTWSVKTVCDRGVCSLQPDSLQRGCPHVGIVCEQPFTQCATGDVRLVGGANSSEGRVEVCLNNHWGKICDDSWDDNAATVVCGQLRLPKLGATAIVGSSYGSSASLNYLLDDVKCSGEEKRLLDCHSSSVLSHNCLHTEEAGVTCHGRIYTPTVTDTNEQPTQDGGGGGDGGDDGKYTSDQVVAITLPVITVVIVVMVTTMVGAWLMLQWRRKRSEKQLNHFPIIARQGIVQFDEFSNSNDTEKTPDTAQLDI
jgi:deleted-in-malignant-brain-tumors protein 1